MTDEHTGSLLLPTLDTLAGEYPLDDGAADLADAFAAAVVRWAQAAGVAPHDVPLLAGLARALSLAASNGDACLSVPALVSAAGDSPAGEQSGPPAAVMLDGVRARLLASGLVDASADLRLDAGPSAAPCRPLVLDGDDRLYLRRYFDHERRLAAGLVARARACRPGAANADAVKALLAERFRARVPRQDDRADWQMLATVLALRGGLTIVSGGPGTGKTTTVVSILACLLAAEPAPRIALAAPTGKAAARMVEALRLRAAELEPGLRARLPAQAYTIHRLLGVTGRGSAFVHDAAHPLPLDVLVVDEASMLDLALADRLVDALPPQARLILLGDKDQLAAVEAGAVFAELSSDPTLSPACVADLAATTGVAPERIRPPAPVVRTPLHDAVIWLTDSHRFRADSGIGRLAADVNAGRGREVLAWVAAGDSDAVQWLDDDGPALGDTASAAVLAGYDGYRAALAALRPGDDPAAVFAAFDRFRVLCAVRQGRRGVEALNARIAADLRRRLAHPLDAGPASPWYPGRPVIVRRNDALLRLFNGDVGLCLPAADDTLRVLFPDGTRGYRAIAPLRLPAHDTAFAITVHKSQGSEFASVMLVLPDRPNRVTTRELVYTAVTRATDAVTLVGPASTFVAACARPTRREGGLLARLREADAGAAAGSGRSRPSR